MGTSRDEMAFRMRSSKFRHVFGSPTKKELCYECVKITKNAHDSNFCAVNPKFVAIVTESAGGGAFVVLSLEKTGRIDINTPRVCGHSGPVLDIKWNPFNDNIIASCSDDATIKLWYIPDEGLKSNLTEWLVDLHGHQRRVGFLEWHPTAENILLSAGYDFKCILWNTETAEPINIINVHTETIFSISWNRDGSLFATTSKDKKIRIIDPREGTVVAEGNGHVGSKASKVVFLGDRNKLFTTGFSRMSERQYGVWDAKNLSKPLKLETIDSSSGVLFPYYDPDTKVVFISGKGDGNIRYFEVTDEPPYVYYLNQYQSSLPQRGLGVMPKRGIDPKKCEIVRFYKLHAIKSLCEPVSMIVPRKSEMFQEDIFPPTASACASLTADEWISGQNREPILISLKDGLVVGMPRKTTAKAIQRKKTGEQRVSGVSSERSPKSPKSSKVSASHTNSSRVKKESAASKKDGAISHTPTITTYKAVKRSTSSVSSTTSGPETRLKRQATAPPMASVQPVSPSKLPASLSNIRKLSSVDDPIEYQLREGKENVNDMINSFERKTNVAVTKVMTRMTNANQPLRVDKKVWTSAYGQVNNHPATNGNLRSDPEPLSSSQSLNTHQGTPHVQRDDHQGTAPYTGSTDSHPSTCALEKAEEELYNNLKITKATKLRKQWSVVSDSDDTSENFLTPPTSPSLSPGHKKNPVTPVTPMTPVTPVNPETPTVDTSPLLQWKCNPLYADNDSSQTGATDIYSLQAAEEKSPVLNEMNDLNRNSPFRHSKQRSSRRMATENGHTNHKISKSEHSSPHKYLSKSESNRMSDQYVSAPNSPYKNGALNDCNSNEESAFLEFNAFPDEAPDNTLIKPSKLRESMRKNKLKRPVFSPNKQANGDTNNNLSKEHGTESCQNVELTDIGSNQYESSTDYDSPSPLNIEPCPRPIDIVLQNSSAHDTSDDQLTFLSNNSSFHEVELSSGDTKVATTMIGNVLVDSLDDTVMTPSKFRESMRRKKRALQKETSGSEEESRMHHVKKVWSSPPEESNPDDVPSGGEIPSTDPELRKAYFRQVEEIKSLKEQITLKDKRIRQLEDEVRVMREQRDMEESTC